MRKIVKTCMQLSAVTIIATGCSPDYTLYKTINTYDYKNITMFSLVFTDSTNTIRVYNNRDSKIIRALVLTLKHSNIVDPNDIGSKASKESYFLTFFGKETKYDKLRISKNPNNYGIISPGEAYYLRNDHLIFVLDSLMGRERK